MNNKEITKEVYSIFRVKLKEIGFKQLKPGKYFYKTDFGYLTLDLQKSQYSLLFYVNFGAHINGAYGKTIMKESNSELFYSMPFYTRFQKYINKRNIFDFHDLEFTKKNIDEINQYIDDEIIPTCKGVMTKKDFNINVRKKNHLFHESFIHRFNSKIE